MEEDMPTENKKKPMHLPQYQERVLSQSSKIIEQIMFEKRRVQCHTGNFIEGIKDQIPD
jgi:hypothetical protein